MFSAPVPSPIDGEPVDLVSFLQGEQSRGPPLNVARASAAVSNAYSSVRIVIIKSM